jgi:hypothetical protein
LTLPFALGAALIVALAAADSASAPPLPNVPNMGVRENCVVYGHSISVQGFGFAPGTTVTLSAPEGHYTGPPWRSTVILDERLIANPTGGFSGDLTAPPAPKRIPWSYQPRVISATGTAQGTGGEGESFDEVLIGTQRVCRTLEGQGQ